MSPRKLYLPDTRVKHIKNSEYMAMCIRPVQIQVRKSKDWEGKVDRNPHN